MEDSQAAPIAELASSLPEGWDDALCLPCRLSVDLSVSGVTVGQLLKLQLHSVISTGQEEGASVPVLVNGKLIAWGEFEPVGSRLAVHLLELI